MKRVMALGAMVALLVAPLLVRLLKAQSPPTHFAVLPPATANVGFVFNFPVTAFDSSNNSAKSYMGTVHFTSTDPQAVLPADYTFTTGDSGTHMFSATLNTPGTQTITATDTASGAITGTSNSITVSATPPPPPPTFALTDLGPLQVSAVTSGATALNASGQVTGFRFENFPSPVCFAGGANRAFLWSNGVYTELGTLGGYSSFGYGINNAGQIVGSSDACPNGLEEGQRAFIWQNGVMTALDSSTNSNDSSVAFAINANGDVAGYTNHVGNAANPQAVIWKGGTAAGLTVLQSLACQFTACQTRALAINDSGQAAGWGMGPFVVTASAGSYNANQAAMWDSNGHPTGLGSLGNFWNDQANAINGKGDVAGYSQLDPGVYYSIIRAVVWQNGNPQNPQDVGTIPGIDPIFGAAANITDNSSGAWGINSKGVIVGISGYGSSAVTQGNGGRAFLWIPAPAPGTGGTMHDLLSLLASGTNWRRLEAAWAINDNGQILGVGIDPNQQEHGFMLTPIINPTTTTITTSGTPSVFGQSVSFTASVTPAPPNANAVNDTVTFYDGNTNLGTGTYNANGVWIFNTALSVGNHSITASYGGDNNFGPSTSTALSQTVGQAGTVTGLTSSANTPNVGHTVTFTASVTVVAPGAGTPTGTVTFTANGTSLICTGGNQTVSAGQATCPYAFGTAGAESITASYNGDTNFTGSASSAVTVTVQAPPPSVVQVTDNETIHVVDTESFADVFDTEVVHVADAAFVTPLIQVSAPVAEFSAGALGFSGQSGSQTITVSDIGTASLTLASASISGSSQFSITQVACSNSATSFSTMLPSGGACVLTIGYSASATPANDNAALVFTDNAALSNVASVPAGSSYTQSIPLSGSGATTPPPPPPPAVVPVMDNETIHVTDTESFEDVYDSEAVHVADAAFVTPLIQVSAPVAEFSAGALGFSGQSGSQTITVSDIGTASLTLASATISGGSQFAITQIACSNGVTSASTTLPSGGACVLTIGYTASGTPANDNATLVFTDNAALSNLASTPAGSSYTQSIPLNGSGTTTPPPPPPPAVIPVTDNETITVTDAESFPDVFDTEAVHVADAAFVTPLIQVSAPVAEFSAGALGFSGQSGSQTITVSDIGTGSLTITSATISGGSQFAITQIACSNSAASASTTLPSGGACVLTIGYSASPTPANDNATLVFTDNAALSNVVSAQAGSSYIQSIPLSGSGTTTGPPPPPPAVIPVMDNETITVTDTETFHDVFDAEAITVTDQVTIQIISIPTTTSITAPQAPYGTASATVSVSASSGTATGIVTLSVDGGSPLSMKLAGGSATFSLATINAGGHSLSASFAAQGAFAASSATTKIIIDQASPTVSFTGAPSSAAYQSAFTVATVTNATTTATITASGACSIAGTTVTMTSGTGTCNLTANWPADTNYLAATATQTTAATKIAATASFTGAPATAPYNSTFAVTATTNASTTATITASGVCSITGTKVTMTSGTGACGLLAQWPADGNYLAAAAKQSTTATPAQTKTAITALSPNPSLVGQAVTVKFIVTGNGLPTGTVIISDGTGDLCTATVASGVCSVSITSAGAKTLTAAYGGDSNFAASTSGGVSQIVNKGNTTIKITAHSPTSSVAGQPVAISFVVAVVAPSSGTVSGSVTLSDGVGDTCTAPVSSGTCSMIFAAAGTKTVTASYGGDNNFNPSTSSSVAQTVTDFTISAKPSSQIIRAGQKGGYNTTLTPLNAFVGTVSVSCGGAPPGATCTVSPNSATMNGSMAMTLSISVQTSRNTPTGNYSLTLKGILGSGAPVSGGLTHTATVTLTVQ